MVNKTENKPWRKVQPTFRVFPSTQRLWKALRENGVDVARFVDDRIRELAEEKELL